MQKVYEIAINSLGEVIDANNDVVGGTINLQDLAHRLGVPMDELPQDEVDAEFDRAVREILPPHQYEIVAATWAAQKFTTDRFRFYGGIRDNEPFLRLETEFRFPVEPETEGWWENLYSVASENKTCEVDVMEETVEDSEVRTVSGPGAGTSTYGPWHGKTCRQVGMRWDVFGLDDVAIQAKIATLEKATETLWAEGGVSVL